MCCVNGGSYRCQRPFGRLFVEVVLADAGKAVAGEAQQLMIGVAYQYWRNKLGTDEDESIAQMPLVWRL